MIAEESLSNEDECNTPEISISRNTLTYSIINSLKQSVPFFKSYITTHLFDKTLNEDELTQVFVEQLDIQLRKLNYPFSVKNQYCDIYHESSGFSDFYFHPIEEGKSTASIFSVESKRLPAPSKSREKEYVIGERIKKDGTKENNGGIERYKLEIHGKGLFECGMLGFIEKENSSFWKTTINKWIEKLSKSDKNWNKDEVVKKEENNSEFMYLKSVAHTTASRNVLLHHLWISRKEPCCTSSLTR